LTTIFQKTGQILINTFKATTEATSLRYQSDWWSGKSLVRLKRYISQQYVYDMFTITQMIVLQGHSFRGYCYYYGVIKWIIITQSYVTSIRVTI